MLYFWYTAKSFSLYIHTYMHIHVHVCVYINTHIPFHVLFHYGLLQNIEYSALCCRVGPCCLFILYIIFVSPNPKLLTYPSLLPVPFGNRMFVFCL